MSVILENCAGRVHVVTVKGGGVGLFKVDPAITVPEGGKCLIMGIPVSHAEIVQPSVTLDEKRSIYVFGSAWSEASISGLLLLGDRSVGGAALDSLMSWYDTNRISKRMSPVGLSYGRAPLQAYVTGLQLGATEPNFNTQAFTITTLISKV